MASSSFQNNLDLNVVPEVQPEIWRPSFLSQKGHLMTNDSVMLDDTVAASVAQGIITPRDEKLLADRTNAQAINDSLAFSIQGASSVSNMARRLQVRGNEIQALKAQVLILQRMYMDFRRRNRVLQQENRKLKKVIDSYANDLGKRYAELEKNTSRLREQHESLLLEVQRVLKMSHPKA
jgi:predicted RNase H-like nuclease (RuvC/YqgF family)